MLREENFVHRTCVAAPPHNSFNAGDLKRFDGHELAPRPLEMLGIG